MFKFRKQISFLLVIVMMLSCTPLSVFANQYLTRTAAAELLVNEATAYNPSLNPQAVLKGELGKDNDKYVNRIDFLVMAARAFDNMPAMTSYQEIKAPVTEYTDVPDWAASSVNKLIDCGILTDDGDMLLKPNENITIDEVQTIIKRMWSLYGTNLKDDYASYIIKESKTDKGALYKTAYTAQERTYNIIKEICFDQRITSEKEQKIYDYFDAMVDLEGREKQGIAPIKGYIDAINNAKTHKELEDAVIMIKEETKLDVLFDIYYSADFKDSNKWVYFFSVYPATFYQDELSNDYDGIEKAFNTYVATAFRTSGQSAGEAAKNSEILFAQEAELAEHSLNVEQANDPSSYNNSCSFKDINDKIKVFDMERFFRAGDVDTSKGVYIPDTGLYNFYINKYLDGNHLEDLKRMALINLMANNADVLTCDLWVAEIKFNNYITGNSSYNDYDDETLLYYEVFEKINDIMAPYIEEIYCKRFYSDATTQKIKAMIDDIIAVYEENISRCSWMTSTTKEKAIKKLNNISCKVGHPDKFDDILDSVTILNCESEQAAYLNDLSINRAYHKENCEIIKKPVDKTKWGVRAYEVNASYLGSENSIYIPAGILSSPMYSNTQDMETIMGQIGYVIAHEISHAFDISGSQYDEKGNIANWWTQTDKAAFNKLCNNIADYYDGYEAFNGIATRGRITVGENSADICAMNCMLTILSKYENVDYDKFFRASAMSLVTDDDRAYEEYMNAIDVHARGNARINPVVSNFEEFYETYGVSTDDGMYVAPENRIKYW